MARAYIKKVNNSSVIEIDGKVFNGGCMTVANNRNGVNKVSGEYYKKLAESGIKLYFVMCDLEFSGKNGYEDMCNQMKVIVDAVPDCYVVLRIALHPSAEWVENHPNAVMKFSDGVSHPAVIRQESGSVKCIDGYNLYSQEFKEDAGKSLIEFIEKADKEQFGDRIIGYQLGAGACSEWHSNNSLPLYPNEPYYDLSEDFHREFQAYLDEKYGKGKRQVEILDNEARYFISYMDENVALHSKSPSSFVLEKEKLQTNGKSVGTFCDITKYHSVVDFYMAFGVATANSLIYFAKLVKEKFNDKIVGAFFGYTNGVHQSMNLTGLEKVLNSGVVDFCAAPNCYENRELGGNEPIRSIRDTFSLHNMVFFAEDDTRTHLEPFSARSSYGVYTEQDSVDIIKRNFAKNFLGRNYGWWYDQQHGGGRYDNKGILDTFKKQSQIAENAGEKPFAKNNQVAFVFDIESCVACSNYTSHQTISILKNYTLGNIGCGYDEYLVSDLKNENVPDYKLYIFGTVCDLDNKKREIITKKLQKNNAVALWFYGAGFLNPDNEQNKISVENIKRLTGFQMEMQEDVVYDEKFRAYGNHQIATDLIKRHTYGGYDKAMYSNQAKHYPLWQPYLSPRFVVKDNEATTLGLYNEDQDVAFAVKEYNGFTSVYCGVKFVQADVIRAVCKFANCHIYSFDGDTMYFSENYITIHASSTGKKTINFKEKCSLYELYEQKYYGKDVCEVVLDMVEGQTLTFELIRQ